MKCVPFEEKFSSWGGFEETSFSDAYKWIVVYCKTILKWRKYRFIFKENVYDNQCIQYWLANRQTCFTNEW